MKKFLITAGKTLAFFIGFVLMAGLLPIPETTSDAVWRFWAELIPFLAVVLLTVVFWLLEKRKIRIHLVYSALKNSAIGIGTGCAWIGVVTIIMLSSGIMKITGSHTVPMLGFWVFSAFLNTVMQELLVRGYLYQMIKSIYNPIAAVVVTSILFTLLHGGAFEAGFIAVMNVLTMSFLMTVVLEYTGSLVAPVWMHFSWNCVGGIILGGVSLAEDYPNVFFTEFIGNNLLSGGAPKMEGSIIVLLVNILLLLVFGYLLKKRLCYRTY